MNSLTKFIGTIIIFFGLMLVFTGCESTEMELEDTIFLTITGLLITVLGGICWVWCEPYEGPEM